MIEERLILSNNEQLHDLLASVLKEEEGKNVLFHVTYPVIWGLLMQEERKSATFSSLSPVSKRIMIHWDFSQAYMAFESEDAGQKFIISTVSVADFKYIIADRKSPDVVYLIDID